MFLDQYDSEYFETTGSVRCSIPLINCRNLEVSKSSPHTFEFTCNAGKYTMGVWLILTRPSQGHFRFGCSSREEADGWLKEIRRATSHERMKASDSVRVQSDATSCSPATSGMSLRFAHLAYGSATHMSRSIVTYISPCIQERSLSRSNRTRSPNVLNSLAGTTFALRSEKSACTKRNRT